MSSDRLGTARHACAVLGHRWVATGRKKGEHKCTYCQSIHQGEEQG